MDTVNILVMALQGLTGAFCCVLLGIINDLKRKAEKNSEDLAAFKVLTSEKFMPRTELKEAFDSINRTLEQSSIRLDARLNKIEERILEARWKDHQP